MRGSQRVREGIKSLTVHFCSPSCQDAGHSAALNSLKPDSTMSRSGASGKARTRMPTPGRLPAVDCKKCAEVIQLIKRRR